MYPDYEQPPNAGPSLIEKSWRRCLEHGLSTNHPARQDPVHFSQLKQTRDQNHVLLRLASKELDVLEGSMSAAGGMVLLANAEGVILDARGDCDFLGRARRVSLQPGAVWTEAQEGTNAVGTALIERRAVQVRGKDHFLQDNHFLVCTATPLMTPQGELAGVIDLSGDVRRPPAHCEMLIRLAGAHIEHSWTRETEGHDLLVAFHPHPSWLGTPCEGLLAFRDGVLIGACQFALHLLGLTPEAINRIGWSEIFCASSSSGGSELRLQMTGARVCARVERPGAQRPVKTGSPGPSEITLMEDAIWDVQTLALLTSAERAVRANIPILLQGETGTGKEIFVQSLLHRAMPEESPLVTVNCAAIPEGLLEAELFGYQEGAFTGARRGGSPGYVRQANGGTLFLDEIGDMPLALQSRLLRVLQDGVVIPLGGGRPVKVSFQLIAATHRDLKAEVENGTFRADLYYRIRHMLVTLLPLRERSNLGQILDALLKKLGAPERRISLSFEARNVLLSHSWPGNLRELSNLLHTLVSLAEDDTVIDVDALPYDLGKQPVPGHPQSLAGLTDAAITRVIRLNQGNMSTSAKQLGIHRSTLYRRLHGGDPNLWKA